MHDPLIQLISSYVKLTADEIALLGEAFEPVLVPRNRILEVAGKKTKYLYFVISGYVRLFQYDDNGNENTTHINCPPGFITSYTSYIRQSSSDLNVECITDCELLRITKPNLDRLQQESSKIKDFSMIIFEQSLTYNESRSRDLATLTAEQRYQKLLKLHPDLLQNVPLQYIASFLGMKPESLSRIRRQIIS